MFYFFTFIKDFCQDNCEGLSNPSVTEIGATLNEIGRLKPPLPTMTYQDNCKSLSENGEFVTLNEVKSL